MAGLIQRIRMLLDPASVEQAKQDAASAGAGLGEKLAEGTKGAGKKAARALLSDMSAQFDVQMGELRRKLAMGLISEEEFRKQGTMAARSFNMGMLSGMNGLRSTGQITEKQFTHLSNQLKDTGNVGVSSFARIRSELSTLGSSALAQGIGLGGLLFGIREVNKEAATLQASMTGLASIAVAFGSDQHEAQQAALSLAQDGLMPVSDAATGLKNLLAAGFNLPQAIQLMNRFKDSAAFARQGSLSFGQAIVGATEGIKNGNSALVDNAGVTKNLSNMLEDAGFSAQDLSKAGSDVGVRMAIFNGILHETNPQLGNAALYAGSAAGQLAKLDATATQAEQTLGIKLLPVTGKLAGGISSVLVPAIRNLIAFIESLGAVSGGIWLVLQNIGNGFGELVNGIVMEVAKFADWTIGIGQKIPFIGAMFGVDVKDNRLRVWLHQQIADARQFMQDFRRAIIPDRDIASSVGSSIADAFREANTQFDPSVTVPEGAGAVNRNKKPGETAAERKAREARERAAAAAARRELDEQVNLLSKALDLNLATNTERQQAVDLLARYNAQARNTNLSTQQRLDAAERAKTLQDALNRAQEEERKKAEETRQALLQGLQARILTAAEMQQLLDAEEALRVKANNANLPLKDRVDAARELAGIEREIAQYRADQTPVAQESPEEAMKKDAQDILDALNGAAEDADPQGFFENIFYGIASLAEDAANGVADAFQTAFGIIFEEGGTLLDAMGAFAKGVASALTGAVSSYARKKVGENVAAAIEEVAKGLAAAANPLTAWEAPMHYHAAAQHGLAAGAWAVLAGASGAATSAISSGGGSSRNSGGSVAEGASRQTDQDKAKSEETHVYVRVVNQLDPFDPARPQVQDFLVKGTRLGLVRHGPDALTEG